MSRFRAMWDSKLHRRNFLRAAGAGAGASLLTGCLGDDDDDDVDDTANGDDDDTDVEAQEVVIGAIQPFTGPFAPWGEAHDLGLDMQMNDVNAAQDEYDFVVESVDTGGDPSEASVLFTELVEADNAVAITGAVSSDVGVATAEIAEEMETTNLLHMAGDDAILTQDSRYTFRGAWVPAYTHVTADFEFIESQDYTSVGVVVADYAWGRAVEAAFDEIFADDIDVHLEVVPLGESDYGPALRSMPDEVEIMDYVGDPAGAISAVSTQIELGIDIPALGVDPPQADIFGALGEDVEDFIITRHLADIGGDRFLEFAEQVAEEHNRPAYAYEPLGYVAGEILTDAVREVGPDRPAIANYIRESSFDTMYVNPVEYTEWGELDGAVLIYSEMELEPPEYFPDGDFRLSPVFETDPLEPFEP